MAGGEPESKAWAFCIKSTGLKPHKKEMEVEERTPGIRRALKALARRRNINLKRVARGEKPIVQGKKVSSGSVGLSKTKAQQRLRNKK